MTILVASMMLQGLSVSANDIGSLSVTVLHEEHTKGVNQFGVYVCQVTILQEGKHQLTEPFMQSGISIKSLYQDSRDQAQAVYEYVRKNHIPCKTVYTDWNGNAHFPNLAHGIYLVYGQDNRMVSFNPYLISVPITVNGQVVYDVSSTPKTTDEPYIGGGGGGTPTHTNISITKQWKDQNDKAGKRPEQITVKVIAGNSTYKTVTLKEQEGWTCVVEYLPASLAYTVEEVSVNDYSASYSGNATEGFVIENEYTEGITDPGTPPKPSTPDVPEEPTDEKPGEKNEPSEPSDNGKDKEEISKPDVEPEETIIPQTGAIMWPVYLLMFLGVLLVGWGLMDIYSERGKHE